MSLQNLPLLPLDHLDQVKQPARWVDLPLPRAVAYAVRASLYREALKTPPRNLDGGECPQPEPVYGYCEAVSDCLVPIYTRACARASCPDCGPRFYS